MISINDARRLILEQVAPVRCEEVSLLDALGRISCEDVYAHWDIPSADSSAMDGYSFQFASSGNNSYSVVDFIPAGAPPLR